MRSQTMDAENFLKLNADKTEIFLVGPKSLISSQNDIFIHIIMESILHPLCGIFGYYLIPNYALNFASANLLNRVFLLSQNCSYMTFAKSQRCRNFFPCFNLASQLMYSNSLFWCQPTKALNCLQLVQNSAARALTLKKKSAHITPILQHRTGSYSFLS